MTDDGAGLGRIDARYRDVQAAYDQAAAKWGTAFGMGPQGAHAKGVAMRRIKALVPSGGALLDIGCDIGYEAILFTRQGYTVTGIDLSDRMLDLARARRDSAGVPAASCKFEQRAAAHCGDMHPRRFDAAYSVYGALNLEPDVDRFAAGLAGLLDPGSPAVIGLLNRAPLYELAAYPLAFRFNGWRKLLFSPVRLRLARGSELRVECHMYTPGQFARRMRPWFRLRRCRGVHILLPPPTAFLLRRKRLLARVNRFEDRVGGLAPWNRLGYFSLLEFERTHAR